jgi:hypothetical protein
MDVRLTPAGLPSAPAGVSSPMLLGAWAQEESSCPGEIPGRCVRTSSTKIKPPGSSDVQSAWVPVRSWRAGARNEHKARPEADWRRAEGRFDGYRRPPNQSAWLIFHRKNAISLS